MLITAAQVAHMKKHTQETFLRRVMRFVVERCGPQGEEAELRQKCLEMIGLAMAYGFSTELEVATFTMCGFVYGVEFASNAALPFQQLLADPALDFAGKSDKMAAVLEGSEVQR